MTSDISDYLALFCNKINVFINDALTYTVIFVSTFYWSEVLLELKPTSTPFLTVEIHLIKSNPFGSFSWRCSLHFIISIQMDPY